MKHQRRKTALILTSKIKLSIVAVMSSMPHDGRKLQQIPLVHVLFHVAIKENLCVIYPGPRCAYLNFYRRLVSQE